ncbi:MAG: hypothetical protein DRQ14_00870 [Candidatus Latescibacterota bacterium]|nr:MAG: hypothetical protein DRQ14_00870 [Candidatus Latescibacterota bacterium]
MFLRQYVPMAIAFVMGVVFAVQYYVPHPASEELLTTVNDWLIVVSGFSMVLGLASLMGSHWAKVRRGVPGWGYSLVVFLGILGTLAVGIASKGKMFAGEGLTLTALGWVYDNMLVPLQGTVFSLLAFFMASATFRTFRARNLEAGLLLTAAFLVMLGHVPLGEYIWDKVLGFLPPKADQVMGWIMNVPNMAAKRGILLGVGLGMIATSLKIIFGIERAYMGEGE